LDRFEKKVFTEGIFVKMNFSILSLFRFNILYFSKREEEFAFKPSIMTEDIDPNNNFNPAKNFKSSKQAIGYVSLKEATQTDYDRIGFKSGLEVHQQLKTKKKLFCRCPAGLYNRKGDYDAEIIRHMRPTLSELGEYDGTALMEFKTRKQIIYRIKNQTACTYDIDDTPPFPLNKEALDIALEISLMCKLNIVGEVHIIRKQYLDGSIPTGFQRTAILGVEGEIQLRNKKVRLIQLSVEEDSCREISDIGHIRIYQTDRLGIPLIETVTYPDFANPDEVREGAEYIRFLNRSTGKVATGIGSGREDVNVSCRGGNRVEIKGVSHNKWIPELTHNEAFRQWALLRIQDLLNKKVKNQKNWKIIWNELDQAEFDFLYPPLASAIQSELKVIAINLPDIRGILSHFTQPGKMFADELSDRLKVIACIEKPNMTHSEELEETLTQPQWQKIRTLLGAGGNDTQIILWGTEEDIPTAIETVEERCRLAFKGVPRESRKSFEDGTTIFERVLPGPNRMYPDTDSAPIPLDDDYIDSIKKRLPVDISTRYSQMQKWGIPSDTFPYLLRNNLLPLLEKIIDKLEIDSRFAGTLLGHNLKHIEGQLFPLTNFSYDKVFKLLKFLKEKKIDIALAKKVLAEIYRYPQMDFESVLTTLKFKKIVVDEILEKASYLIKMADRSGVSRDKGARIRWIMGQLHETALGNISMSRLEEFVAEKINHKTSTKRAEQ
jgi:glutamyl-tRNA(Gln) amidotransferase subunit E